MNKVLDFYLWGMESALPRMSRVRWSYRLCERRRESIRMIEGDGKERGKGRRRGLLRRVSNKSKKPVLSVVIADFQYYKMASAKASAKVPRHFSPLLLLLLASFNR